MFLKTKPFASLLLLIPCLMTPLIAQEESVKPGINDSWKSEKIDPLIDTLEAESREIYAHRAELADLVGPQKGQAIADIGAGSGFMALLFAERVGPTGTVYAVDINPKMMENVAKVAKKQGLKQLKTVTCTDKSTELPPQSVDLVFICDTYHHFEYPNTVLASIHQALKPGGQIVLVDFKRDDSAEPWIFNHVRAGKEGFSKEIEANGFKRVKEEKPAYLKENYFLRFVKTEKP